MDPLRAYADLLARAGREAVPALARDLGLPPAAAGDAFAATAALVLAGLARHRARRAEPGAVAAVIDRHGRPADVDAPALAVAAHLARAGLSPRLGGLLGDAADAAVAWLAERTGAAPEPLGRAVAASAPIALGALHAAVGPDGLAAVLDAVGTATLDDPRALAARRTAAAGVFRRVRRGARPFWGWRPGG